MTPDEPDSDRTLIQPPGSGGGAAGFDKTDVYAATPSPPPLAATVLVPPPAPDMGNGLAIGTRLGEFELLKLLGDVASASSTWPPTIRCSAAWH